jgi:DeoR/GlpR family transcriptional regulator of sugar metabolism
MEQEQILNYFELLDSKDIAYLSKKIGCSKPTIKKYLTEMNVEKSGLAKACSDYVIAITKAFLEEKRIKFTNI